MIARCELELSMELELEAVPATTARALPQSRQLTAICVSFQRGIQVQVCNPDRTARVLTLPGQCSCIGSTA